MKEIKLMAPFPRTEGIATCIVALFVLAFLVDFPDKAARPRKFGVKPFLTADEATIALNRIERDRGDATPEKMTVRLVLSKLKDWKQWEMCILLLCNVRRDITIILYH